MSLFDRLGVWWLCFLLVSGFAFAQGHLAVIDPYTFKPDSEDKSLTRKHTLFVSSENGQKCGGSVVSCEGQFYILTARHCLRNGKNLQAPLFEKFEARFAGEKVSNTILLKQALQVKEVGDLVRVKMPSESAIVKYAKNQKLVLPCFQGKLTDLDHREVVALGRPVLGGAWLPMPVSCKGTSCSFNNNSSRPLVTLDKNKSYSKSLIGMSGSPVVLKDGDQEYFLGVVSQHMSTGKVNGPLQFAPLPELYGGTAWKNSQVGN